MGPMLMTGLACFGAAVAIGLLARATWQPTATVVDATTRSLAYILMAFAEGVAVVGIVVGILAVNAGVVTDPAVGVLAAGPAVLGVVVGMTLVVGAAARSDPQMSFFGVLFIVPLGVLGVVVALLATFLVADAASNLVVWPFLLLAPACAASALAVGMSGGVAIRSMRGVDEPTAVAIHAEGVSRCARFVAVALVSTVIAIALIATA